MGRMRRSVLLPGRRTLPLGASPRQKREAATMHLGGAQCATWVWSDGSVVGGTHDGGAGVFIEDPDGETHVLREPAGIDRTDELAKEASALPQENAPRTSGRCTARRPE